MAKESVESLCQLAQEAVAKGKNDTARQLYLKALGHRTDVPDVHYGLATVCFLLNDLPSAAYHFKEVARLDPLRAGAHVNLGAVYNRMDMLDEAIAVLRRGIQLDHNRAEGFYNLGVVYRRKGQFDMAIQAYREAVRLNPRMSDAHYNIANIYLDKEQPGLALAHYKQALETRPNWKKAKQGLDQCEELMNPSTAKTVISAPILKERADANTDNEATKPSLDPQRAVDPETHGVLLTSLHKATIESDGVSRALLKILEKDLEPAIKELGACVLHPETSAQALEQCISKFESVTSRMQKAREDLHSSLKRVQKLGNDLLRS